VRRKLILAGVAALAVFLASRFGITWFLAIYACPNPDDWLPDWATYCGSAPLTQAAQSLMQADWGSALPAMLAAGTFLLVGLPRKG
jgi:hypothetical protein